MWCSSKWVNIIMSGVHTHKGQYTRSNLLAMCNVMMVILPSILNTMEWSPLQFYKQKFLKQPFFIHVTEMSKPP